LYIGVAFGSRFPAAGPLFYLVGKTNRLRYLTLIMKTLSAIPLFLLAVLLCVTSTAAMAQKSKKNKVIAHRGAWKNTGAPQNSIAALEHAIKLGCVGSEFDVHMSADSVMFVCHDHTIQGIHIEKTNASDLSKIKLSNGESLPTLEAYLLAGKKQKKTRLVLEIKTSQISKERSLALARLCVELVKKTKTKKIVDYIAFDYDVCKKVKELDPSAAVAYLSSDKAPAVVAQDKIDGLDYHFSAFKKNENWIEEAKAQKLSLNVWTVNDKESMKWFLEKNLDFITTDEPEILLEMSK
jgi:glycerophosphoryl diester phosphodiesterase